jgi:hypothetical protein
MTNGPETQLTEVDVSIRSQANKVAMFRLLLAENIHKCAGPCLYIAEESGSANPCYARSSGRSSFRDMDSQSRRLQVLGAQLAADIGQQVQQELSRSDAASTMPGQDGYAVALPEHLTPDGPWNVHR